MNRDYTKLKEDLICLGLQPGDSVLIHSSFKAMGKIDGGIQTLLDALRSVVKDSGTLVFPTLTHAGVTPESPVFSQTETPSCVGAVSEYVRTLGESLRSVHPTHSCAALGKLADTYTQSHHLDNTPVGEHSPFFKLKENGGKILMLGCGLKPNTSMHGVEEAFRTPYVLSPEPFLYTIKTPEGEYQKPYYRHWISQNGYAQRYDRVITVLNQLYIIEGLVHGAKSYLIDSAEMWKQALQVMKRDPHFFVDKIDE
ncbi:AAC(3) family N-acetyltransferase [Acetivibrio sp. MSJd-27]|uniref:AAC(3) family N-acetyltransferase n=1 Tax=Acetivibrio sp. MSJd-27 TaxID=2841523 RepID=UPI001C122344|nr:AAC(3) family N-acetyltransferase [Acetivibrio sp. MSJd-27]MBU5449496.1 AAC(3) family N-acetyltransferase [Acetivibrio sp. MSJd-27]